jgi:D-alanine-D-alanine ligase
MIKGREFTIAILDGKALPPVEIIPKCGFYDYKNKYQSGLTEEICPAHLTEDENKRLAEAALAAFSALRMEMYGRADFILGSDGEFYCLEVNALPGMTPTSLLPQEAAAVGIGYDALCELLVKLAYKK